jgi:hypothetical protein
MSKKKVEVRRRRRAEPSEAGERERATAPSRGRRRDTPQTDRPTSQATTSRPAGSAAEIPMGSLLKLLGGGKLSLPMILGILGILAVCACLYIFVLGPAGPGDDSALPPAATQPAAVPQATMPAGPSPTSRPFTPSSLVVRGGTDVAGYALSGRG